MNEVIMTATPGGTVELTPTTTIAPEGTSPIGAHTNADAAKAASLVTTVETAMTGAPNPGNETDARILALTGDPNANTPPNVDIEAINPTADAHGVISEVTTPAPEASAAKDNDPVFPFVMIAQNDLNEAEKKGANPETITRLKEKLGTANRKETLLMSNVRILQIDAQIKAARENGASKEEIQALEARRAEAVSTRNSNYDNIFQQIARISKQRGQKPFNELVDEFLLDDAVLIVDDMKLSLKEAERDGKPEEIELAKLRLKAAEMHASTTKKKKGRGIMQLLAYITAAFALETVRGPASISKDSIAPKTR